MSENEIKEINEVKEENEIVPLLKPRKYKKKDYPRTEKQQEQFKEVMKRRSENIMKRNKDKKIEAAKLLLENEEQLNIKVQPIKKELPPPTPQPTPRVYDDEPSSSSDDYEKYEVVEPKVKTKKIYVIKKKTKKGYESPSSSEEEEEEIKPVIQPPKNFKSQRNKKSVVKITESNNNIHHIPTVKNYFCD